MGQKNIDNQLTNVYTYNMQIGFDPENKKYMINMKHIQYVGVDNGKLYHTTEIVDTPTGSSKKEVMYQYKNILKPEKLLKSPILTTNNINIPKSSS
jgi:hypothetical protein